MEFSKKARLVRMELRESCEILEKAMKLELKRGS